MTTDQHLIDRFVKKARRLTRRGKPRGRWWSSLTTLGAAIVLAASPSSGLAAARPAPSVDPAPTNVSQSHCTTSYLNSAVDLDGVRVTSAALDTRGTFTPPGSSTPITSLPDFCAVMLSSSDRAGNPVHTAVWLPQKWNGRFQGIGGGGYSCGIFYTVSPQFVSPSLRDALRNGYASASTDCGVPVSEAFTGTWVLNSRGDRRKALIEDWAETGIHRMTVDGQAVTRAFYQWRANYSYFVGCSTGGREGLFEAQHYPRDYNGIVAGSPAINWPKWVPAAMWPALFMRLAHDPLPTCKEDAFQESVVKACDSRDGVSDGVIGDLADCHWNADHLVGTPTPCGKITATDARVMNAIWRGPATTGGRTLWSGPERGASLAYLGATTTSKHTTTVQPFSLVLGWLGEWLQRAPQWNWRSLTRAGFDKLFAQSVRQFSTALATDNPDLASFARRGGKLIIWHGLADPLIPVSGTIDYYGAIQHAAGGAAEANSFARLFLAPGAGHCAPGAGPTPRDPLAAVVKWTEHQKAPSAIPADLRDPSTGMTTVSRKLCPFPLVARYIGHGDTKASQNFRCADDYRSGASTRFTHARPGAGRAPERRASRA